MDKPFHPILFALFPILFLYSYNAYQVYPDVILVPSVIVILFTLILWLVLNLLIKSKEKSGLIVSVFLIMFFSCKHFYLTIIGVFHKGFFTRDVFLFPCWILTFVFFIYLVLKARSNLRNLTKILNIMSITLVTISTLNICHYELFKRYPFYKRANLIKTFSRDIPMRHLYHGKSPDIYYIIFDRYANTNILKEYFNFENKDFIEYLTKKGFYIAHDSKANYPRTYLSIASSLNLDYLDFIKENVQANSNDQTVIYDLLQDYKVWQILKSKGYKFIHCGGRWDPTKVNKFADKNFVYDPLKLDDFSRKLLKSTIFLRQIDRLIEDAHRKQILGQFENFSEISKIDGPKFVFSHFLVPHEPFLFNQAGNKPSKLEQKPVQEKYIDQLIFTNKKITTLVDTIISNSSTPPIIILQSDEGPYIHKDFKAKKGPQIKNWGDLTSDAIKVHLYIFNAYYLPDCDKSSLYSSITPVNTFRLIFNKYLGTDFKLLKDKSYIFEDSDHPYMFVNAANKLKP